jgi:hypothetical protein
MDATTMPSTDSTLNRLLAEYPHIHFKRGSEFSWSPSEKAVYYQLDNPAASALLLHELSHALLGHDGYQRDIELVSLEQQAWNKAKELAPLYDVSIDEDMLQDHLDTYRDWLHSRSTCPHCSAVGHQAKKSLYRCIACHGEWRVNEARTCALRRYKLTI